jgi:hypothetical protein
MGSTSQAKKGGVIALLLGILTFATMCVVHPELPTALISLFHPNKLPNKPTATEAVTSRAYPQTKSVVDPPVTAQRPQTAPSPTPAPKVPSVKFPLIRHIKQSQSLTVMDGLTITPGDISGSGDRYTVQLESPALGAEPTDFIVGGSSTDISVKGNLYTLRVTKLNFDEELITIEVDRAR